MKYSDIINISHNFRDVYNLDDESKDEWKRYIVTREFVSTLEDVVSAFTSSKKVPIVYSFLKVRFYNIILHKTEISKLQSSESVKKTLKNLRIAFFFLPKICFIPLRFLLYKKTMGIAGKDRIPEGP